MPTISLTRFVDFVSKAGRPKFTVVRQTREQLEDGYGPEKDFYKRIREAIIEMHSTGATFSTVSGVLPDLTNKHKVALYPELVAGYKKWSGRKNAAWFQPPHETWSSGGLNVTVNPELGLYIRGKPHLIKLYFKAEPIAKQRIDIVTHLMAIACAGHSPPSTAMGVLDVRRSRLIKPTVPIPGLDAMLAGEAAYWVTAWSDLETSD